MISADEINNFLQNRPGRNQPSYYPPDIMFEDSASPSSGTPSVCTSGTHYSSVFSDAGNAYSETTSASSYPPGHQNHRPTVPDASDFGRLPCEFYGYRSCNATFHVDDERGWITHIAHTHLNHIFPLRCICWFCSYECNATSDSYEGRKQCYRERMHHIAEHFRQGWSIDQMRPDHSFTDHLFDIGMIGFEEHQYLISYHELPQPENYYPAGWRPQRHERASVRVEHRSRRHGDRRIRTQVYHQ